MTFYVRKSLAHGPIRFGVSPRLPLDEIDDDPSLSTGPGGEFLRRRTHGFFLADSRAIGAPDIPKPSSIASTPFWMSMAPEDPRGWALIGMMGVGALFLLLGLAVLINKGPQGIIPLLLGLALIGVPIFITAQKRNAIRSQEDRERAEREERDRINREGMASYATALERVREDPSESNLLAAAREREKLELPYKHWRPLAKRSVLHIGFGALAQLGPKGAKEVGRLIERAGSSVGLDKADSRDVKVDLYRVAVWHLLADDRLGTVQAGEMETLRQGFGITDEHLEQELAAIEEFDRLRGITRDELPREECGISLQFREHCIYTTPCRVLSKKGGHDEGRIILTNKRLIVEGRRRIELALPRIDDVEVDTDTHLLRVVAARPDPPIELQTQQPIYSAALIDIATTIDERPKGFA
ncbi:MAG TPA: hypothetical protein VFM36_13425 [Thermoanaerobaculia bacterium]|nr:hypothetical protein [Thermoanaerobaculia bacterium]